MAKRRTKRIYEVTVEGEYFKGENQTSLLEPYRETVKLNEAHRKAGFVYVFKNHVAPLIMPRKYKGYGGLHTHHLVSVVDLDDTTAVPNDPNLMNLDQLVAFINYNELPVIIDLWDDVDALRQAVIECLEDEETFVEGQDKRAELRGNSIELAQGISELNPELGGGLKAKAKNADRIDELDIPDSSDIELQSDKRRKVKETIDEFTAEELGVESKKPDKNKNKNKKSSGPKKSNLDADDEDDEY